MAPTGCPSKEGSAGYSYSEFLVFLSGSCDAILICRTSRKRLNRGNLLRHCPANRRDEGDYNHSSTRCLWVILWKLSASCYALFIAFNQDSDSPAGRKKTNPDTIAFRNSIDHPSCFSDAAQLEKKFHPALPCLIGRAEGSLKPHLHGIFRPSMLRRSDTI